jgi:hypothetical protein
MSPRFHGKTRAIALCAALGGIALPMAASAQTLGSITGAGAQTAGNQGAPIFSTGNMPLVSNTAGASVGTGTNSQGQAVATTSSGSKQPMVGVGVLDGQYNHSGRVASVSALNTTRLVGVSTGPVGSNGVNVMNPTGKPVLSGVGK